METEHPTMANGFKGLIMSAALGLLAVTGCMPDTIKVETSGASTATQPTPVVMGASDGSTVWIYEPGALNRTVIFCQTPGKISPADCFKITPQ